MSYLEEAADLLRKAADTNEKPQSTYGTTRSRDDINEGRERIARGFANLAAIERGLIPPDMIRDVLAAIRDAGR